MTRAYTLIAGRPPELEHLTEYRVHVRGRCVGFVGKDAPGHWLAYDADGSLLAEIDIETRAHAIDVVLHPERVGARPLED